MADYEYGDGDDDELADLYGYDDEVDWVIDVLSGANLAGY